MRDKDAHRIFGGKPLENRSWTFWRKDMGRTVHKHDNCARLDYHTANSADYHYSLLFNGGSMQSRTVHNHFCWKVSVLAFNFQAVLPQCQSMTLLVMLTASHCFKMCLYSQPSPPQILSTASSVFLYYCHNIKVCHYKRLMLIMYSQQHGHWNTDKLCSCVQAQYK
jgi:hypothetical protein